MEYSYTVDRWIGVNGHYIADIYINDVDIKVHTIRERSKKECEKKLREFLHEVDWGDWKSCVDPIRLKWWEEKFAKNMED